MPGFKPALPVPPKSAITVPPAFRSRKVPKPSPAGGAQMGAPVHGLQYGNKAATGKGWIVRQKGQQWVRMSPKSWRQPRKRLHPLLKDDVRQVPLPKPVHNLGWGVTMPVKGEGKGKKQRGKALPAAKAAAPARQTRAAAKAAGANAAAQPPAEANLRC